MKRFRLRRPSPALIVAIVAVAAASTGSAIAASQITSKQIKNGTIQLKDMSKSARTALKGRPGPQGPGGPGGPAGATGSTGAKGATGPAGAGGTALAYAHVLGQDGSLDLARSKNVAAANVSRAGQGVYCIKLGFTPRNVVATPDYYRRSVSARVIAPGAVDECSPNSVQVETWDTQQDGTLDAHFMIAFN